MKLLGQTLLPGFQQQAPALHQRPLPQSQSLISDGLTERGHRTGGCATDINVMTTASHKGHRIGLTGKHRRNGGDVRQMGAAMEGVVAHQGFAWLQRWTRPGFHLAQQINHHLTH